MPFPPFPPLGKEYMEIPKSDLVIATPFYQITGYAPYIGALALTLKVCFKAGLEVEYWQILRDAYVWRCRNSFAQKFLDETEAKWLIFIDSDMAWDLMGFTNLLKAPVDVVGAAYPCQNNWDFWGVRHHIVGDGSQRPLVDPGTGLISAEWVPTGFMKISRKALETVRANEPYNFYIDDKGTKYHGFFSHITENGNAYGEDISFCVRCLRAGVKLWIEPNICIEHYGLSAHTGNYSDFLRHQTGGDLHKSKKHPKSLLKTK
jgi:hypothetical protein